MQMMRVEFMPGTMSRLAVRKIGSQKKLAISYPSSQS